MPEIKEWTLMFYLASDNPLAPGVVSQLKAIKAAGFHPQANVVTQFDPFVEGTPTHIFEVNLMNKLKHPGVADVGFLGNDPFVRNLVEDKLWREQRSRRKKPLKAELKRILKSQHGVDYDAPVPPEERTDARQSPCDDPTEPDPQESLRRFLSFCRNQYPARHFALFILGHGVVVGNDVFLFDEHTSNEHSISLTELGEVLREFKTDIDDAEFELVSFHSCSVSSLEVVFELQDTAKYMLASQGPAFVGSWPYRSILIRIFNDLVRQGQIDVKRTFHRIFKLCFFNAVDFLLAGYSFQLTLCDLRKVECVKAAIANLVKALLEGLDNREPYANRNEYTRDVILLAHLKSQSFFQEMYTDLYDFCFCISNKVKEMESRVCYCTSPPVDPPTPCNCIPASLRKLDAACQEVMDVLIKEIPLPDGYPPGERLIVSAEFLGPAYQYSRGLSVYFPWTRPLGDRLILAEYARYRFHQDFDPDQPPGHYLKATTRSSWLTFLNEYFDKTLREASSEECDPRRKPTGCPTSPPTPQPVEADEAELREDIANLIYGEGPSLGSYELAGNKTGPKDPTGATTDCDCASIKNYPRDTRPIRERSEQAPEPPQRIVFFQAPFL